jgi:hypothetical protein
MCVVLLEMAMDEDSVVGANRHLPDMAILRSGAPPAIVIEAIGVRLNWGV